jgi:hypothetical protein
VDFGVSVILWQKEAFQIEPGTRIEDEDLGTRIEDLGSKAIDQ